MMKLALVFCSVLAIAVAIPVSNNETGLDAALSSIAHSVVVVRDDTSQHKPNSPVQADEPSLHLQSANALPSLALIALTPEAHNVVAESEKLIYSNETDSKGVIKITVVTPTDVTTEESTTEAIEVTEATEAAEATDAATVRDEEEATTTESDVKETTLSTEKATTQSTTAASVLTVIAIDQIDKDKEEEIKDIIKEVEANPVILTVGV